MARKLAWQLHIQLEIEDVIQSGWLGLVRAAATYSAARGATERFWAWSTIRHEILDRHRDARIWSTCRQELPEELPAPTVVEAPEPTPLSLESLPPIERKLIRLIYEEGRSEREIGRQHLLGSAPHPKSHRRIGVSCSRVRQIHASALGHLKEAMEPRAA
jgi:DNA-directed RNA polymerase specialized sigma subunit